MGEGTDFPHCFMKAFLVDQLSIGIGEITEYQAVLLLQGWYYRRGPLCVYLNGTRSRMCQQQ